MNNCLKCQIPLKKNGMASGNRQKWRCRDCGFSFTENPQLGGRPRIFEDHVLTTAEQTARHRKKKKLKLTGLLVETLKDKGSVSIMQIK
jgi:transposase-like protein